MAPIHSFLIHGGGGQKHVQVTMPLTALIAWANVLDCVDDEVLLEQGASPKTVAVSGEVYEQLEAVLNDSFGDTWRDPEVEAPAEADPLDALDAEVME